MNPIFETTFYQQVNIPNDVNELLVNGERPHSAYKTFRDVAIFTDKRVIIKDAQGMTGKKIEIYSIPYNAIHMWSTENAAGLDFTAEIQLWTRAGMVKINTKKGIDIRELDRLVASAVL